MRTLARLTALVVTLTVAGSAAASQPKAVAVLPLGAGAAAPEYQGLGTALAGMLVTDLSSVPGLQLVERERLQAILAELSLTKTGFVEAKTAQTLGKGVGAELIVTGSFSVVDGRFVMDARMFRVAEGTVVTAASSTGPVSDFVAVEKDVVEQLVDSLKIRLPMKVRRKLLMQAPTESPKAAAGYGRGVEALDAGDVDAAKAAFEAALAADPSFALASSALADLAKRVETLAADHATTVKTTRERSRDNALAKLVDETTRPAGFTHTPATVRDLAIRQYLLLASKQHCRRYEELKAFLVHTKGRFPDMLEKRPGEDHRDAWERTEAVMDARGEALGLVGRGAWFGTRPGEILREAGYGMYSGKGLLLAGNTAPEKFSYSLASALERCHPETVQIAEWLALRELVERWGWADEPLWRTYNVGPSTVTVRDGMDLHLAFLSARSRGVDVGSARLVEQVLARHPEGDPDRGRVLSRMKEIVRAAERRERQIAHRMRLEEAQLTEAADALARRAPGALRLDDALCRHLVDAETKGAARAWERWLEKRDRPDDRQRPSRLDDLGDAIAPARMAGCFKGEGAPKPMASILEEVRAASLRRHPQTLEDDDCVTGVAKLAEATSAERAEALAALPPSRSARDVARLLSDLHRLRYRRCLVP